MENLGENKGKTESDCEIIDKKGDKTKGTQILWKFKGEKKQKLANKEQQKISKNER